MQTSSNDLKPLSGALRAGSVLVAAAVVVPWLWRVAADAGHAAAGGVPLRPDEVLAAAVASAALVGVGWLAATVLLELLALVPGHLGRQARRVSRVVTPALLRRMAAGLLGIGIVAALAPGASVATPAAVVAPRSPLPDPGFAALPDPGWVAPVDQPPPEPGGWVPGPPTVRAQPDVRVLSPSPRSGAGSGAPAEVVVRRGDSLWSIAARHLGRDASEAEVARAWPAWFDANREVIGDDPDVLHPGQVLRPPEGVRS